MKSIIKQAKKLGNSSAVVLPKEWRGKKVVVTLQDLSEETITKEVIEILIEEKLIKETLGIYLTGSRSRGDYEEVSDVDILVITEKTNGSISEGVYSITLIDLDSLKKSLKENLIHYYPMILESKPLINKVLIEKFRKISINKENVLPFLESTKKILKIALKNINEDKRYGDVLIGNAVSYSLVLRLRGLYILECILKNKKWDNKKLIELIREITGSESIYESYLELKNRKKSTKKVLIKDAEKLLEYIKNKVVELERWVKENLKKEKE